MNPQSIMGSSVEDDDCDSWRCSREDGVSCKHRVETTPAEARSADFKVFGGAEGLEKVEDSWLDDGGAVLDEEWDEASHGFEDIEGLVEGGCQLGGWPLILRTNSVNATGMLIGRLGTLFLHGDLTVFCYWQSPSQKHEES